MKKIIKYYRNLSTFDFLRKCIYVFNYHLNIPTFLRKFKSAYYFKKFKINLGRNVNIYGHICNVKIGNGVNIYQSCIFEFSSDAVFVVGDNSLLSYGVLISCRKSIRIGNEVQIGEYTSVRDSTHLYGYANEVIKNIPDESAAIQIGNNVWIGRGCIIMPGTIIEDGVVVGANSVVKGLLQKNGIYAGAPCRLIKYR